MVIISQSIASLFILFCSCFTTQYLLLKYNNESFSYWCAIFFIFFITITPLLYVVPNSIYCFLLFLSGSLSEFIKRLCFYSNKSLISLCFSLVSFLIFVVMVIIIYFCNIKVDSTYYIILFFSMKFIPLALVFIFIKGKSYQKVNITGVVNAFVSSTKMGGVFAIVVAIYWCINQGFIVFSKDNISSSDLVSIRITQNVFGLVTMVASLYDSIFLKNTLNKTSELIEYREYSRFIMMSFVFIIFNTILLYVLSITIYNEIDVLKYSVYFSVSQFFYLIARGFILVLKVRCNLIILFSIYFISFIFSFSYFIVSGIDSSQHLAQSIMIANILIFVFSFSFLIIKRD